MFGDDGLGVLDERVLLAIHERSGGGSHMPVDLGEIQFETRLSDKFMRYAVNSLMSHGYIRWQTITIGGSTGPVVITDKGAAKARDIGEPTSDVGRVPRPRSAERAPVPAIVINVAGDVNNSAIQAGSPRASQTVNVSSHGIGDGAIRQLNAFLAGYETNARQLHNEIGVEAVRVLKATVAAIKAQLAMTSFTPDVVDAHVKSIRTVLNNATGGVVTDGLLFRLAQIRF
jgi:hypothetical protein